jgi:hypothetical protein
VPEWAWPATAVATAGQDQPASPDSKPGLVIVFVSARAAVVAIDTAATAATAAPAANAGRRGLRMV